MADLDLARFAVQLALDAGATQADATANVSERFAVEARDRSVEKLERSIGRSLILRAFVDGAKATLSTTDLSPDGLRALARETVDAARFVGADPGGGLPEPQPQDGDATLVTYDADVSARDPETKIDDALALERAIRRDARIVNSSGSHVADTVASIALSNSHGFAGAYRTSVASRDATPIALDGATKRLGAFGAASRAYATLASVEFVAGRAVERAVGLIGARKPPTMRVPVIFERDVAAAVLSDVFNAVSAANVAIGNSFLAERIGQRVGSALVTIVDDGRLPQGLGSSPFDAEGVPTRRTSVFDGGVFRTFLYDTYYARRLGATSTANAASGGIGPNNFYLAAGTGTLAGLIAATAHGILVTDTIGFATESVTGTYSRGASGYLISGGEIAYPIDEFTVAGNLVEMLAHVDAVADDLVFDQSIVAPSFRVAEMTVSGT